MQESMLMAKKKVIANKTNLLVSLNGDINDQAGNVSIGSTGFSYVSNQQFGRQGATFGPSGYIGYPLTSKVSYASDFTIEFWLNMANLAAEQMAISSGVGCYIDFYKGAGYNGGNPAVLCSVASTNSHVSMFIGNNPFSVGTRHHFAFCRLNGVLYGYGDGVSLGTPVANSSVWGNSAPVIGNYNASPAYGFQGVLQEIRFSNVCRYTGPFTPPTGPFTLD